MGYAVFTKFAGEYIAIGRLISGNQGNIIGELTEAVLNIEEIRRNILLCGAGGAVLGLVLALVSRR